MKNSRSLEVHPSEHSRWPIPRGVKKYYWVTSKFKVEDFFKVRMCSSQKVQSLVWEKKTQFVTKKKDLKLLLIQYVKHAADNGQLKKELPYVINNKWYFVTKIVLTYCEKKFEIRGWRLRIWKWFDLKLEAEGWEFENVLITRTIYSNSERFLITECFFNLFLDVSQI